MTSSRWPRTRHWTAWHLNTWPMQPGHWWHSPTSFSCLFHMCDPARTKTRLVGLRDRSFCFAAGGPRLWNSAVSAAICRWLYERFKTQDSTVKILLKTLFVWSCGAMVTFCRAMHYSAKRDLAITCRPSVCEVDGLWSLQVGNLWN